MGKSIYLKTSGFDFFFFAYFQIDHYKKLLCIHKVGVWPKNASAVTSWPHCHVPDDA